MNTKVETISKYNRCIGKTLENVKDDDETMGVQNY
jgi:hypothetical protein